VSDARCGPPELPSSASPCDRLRSALPDRLHLREAPTLTFARGSLGAPGQQRSKGFSLVMALNIIAVLAVVVGFVIVIAS
jgi:hypothetical protein